MSEVATSDRRIEANRLNAQKSTGPKSAEGKATVAQNAVKHGLRAEDPFQKGAESLGKMRDFVDALRRDLQPAGSIQEIVFERIVNLAWRLKRLPRSERAMLRIDRQERSDYFAGRAYPDAPRVRDEDLVAVEFLSGSSSQNHYLTARRYEASFERSLYRAMSELRKLQELQMPD